MDNGPNDFTKWKYLSTLDAKTKVGKIKALQFFKG